MYVHSVFSFHILHKRSALGSDGMFTARRILRSALLDFNRFQRVKNALEFDPQNDFSEANRWFAGKNSKQIFDEPWSNVTWNSAWGGYPHIIILAIVITYRSPTITQRLINQQQSSRQCLHALAIILPCQSRPPFEVHLTGASVVCLILRGTRQLGDHY